MAEKQVRHASGQEREPVRDDAVEQGRRQRVPAGHARESERRDVREKDEDGRGSAPTAKGGEQGEVVEYGVASGRPQCRLPTPADRRANEVAIREQLLRNVGNVLVV